VGNEHFESHILNGVKCPTCRGHYSLLKFLGRKGDLYKVLVHCAVCDTYGIGTARLSSPEAPPEGETELQERVQEKMQASPVSADDVLDMHEFLQSFDGNFASLFRH